ncbi:MAG TPA: hypothetical protein VFD58_08000 [Blastocatellia bacterium]|nr:hypothetical protein [Blastocatellia bacterium]
MKSIFTALLLLFVFTPRPAAAQRYQFAAEHLHTLRNCRGTLVITPDGIEYQTDHKPDARAWRYVEIRQITVVSPAELALTTYEDQRRMVGRDRVFRFRLPGGKLTPEISAMLMERATHPIATSVMPQSDGTPAYEVPVRHLHRFGGSAGVLKIYPDRMTFESRETPSDSRFWRYSDIQNFSQSERFRFEIATFEGHFGGQKSYDFQLKEDLPSQAYDYVWVRVYPPKLRRDESAARPDVRLNQAGVR